MAGSNRVAWREGQFLRPQHFQQADRSIDSRLKARADLLRPYPWGLSEIVIDEDMASLGSIGLDAIPGVSADGPAFAIPD